MPRLEVDCTLHYRSGFKVQAQLDTEARVIGLLGPSGSGKTSLLSMIAGVRQPDVGRIVDDGRVLFDHERHVNLPPEQRHVGYVYQESLLFPHLSVRDNLLYGRRRMSPRGELRELDEVAAKLELTELLDRPPGTLSGGQQRRVAVGRAVLMAPRLLILDEPLNSLDEDRGTAVLDLIRYTIERHATRVLYVTHVPTELQGLGATVFEMRQGRIEGLRGGGVEA